MRLVKLYTFTFLGEKKNILTGRQSSSGPKYPLKLVHKVIGEGNVDGKGHPRGAGVKGSH